jgi:hypothetical protein
MKGNWCSAKIRWTVQFILGPKFIFPSPATQYLVLTYCSARISILDILSARYAGTTLGLPKRKICCILNKCSGEGQANTWFSHLQLRYTSSSPTVLQEYIFLLPYHNHLLSLCWPWSSTNAPVGGLLDQISPKKLSFPPLACLSRRPHIRSSMVPNLRFFCEELHTLRISSYHNLPHRFAWSWPPNLDMTTPKRVWHPWSWPPFLETTIHMVYNHGDGPLWV